MHFPFGVTVTVSRPGGTDRNGNPLPGIQFTIADCAYCPISSIEVLDARDTVKTGVWLFGQVDADLEPNDNVWLPDDDLSRPAPWFVDGDVWRFAHHPFTPDPEATGFKCDLGRVEG